MADLSALQYADLTLQYADLGKCNDYSDARCVGATV
jgi:hypothetical protein